MTKKRRYFVDLFAGAGGLSLGLENAGFTPAYVNEIDPNAMETYLINRIEEFPHLKKFNSSDIKANLTVKKNALSKLASDFQDEFGLKKGDLDLVVGGPPCQGYSGIGYRRTFDMEKKEIPSNHLYLDMIKVITKMSPKAFMFENVAGLLRGKWTKEGEKGEIWNDVSKSFQKIKGYTVRSQLIHSKQYGVPQNRPRIIMVGVRDDQSFTPDADLVCGGLLPEFSNDYPTAEELFSDLIDPEYETEYKTSVYPHKAMNSTQKKFRTTKHGKKNWRKGENLTDHEYSRHSKLIKEKFAYMISHGGKIPDEMKTKKFAQRLLPKQWNEGGPNITATSLPDDYCHFSQPRSLTVREWARLQTFPDCYQFTGKRTTGGRRRAGDPSKGDFSRETPKYTQIGNAVPVQLAEKVGKHLHALLN